jgi:hypothetical protein
MCRFYLEIRLSPVGLPGLLHIGFVRFATAFSVTDIACKELQQRFSI